MSEITDYNLIMIMGIVIGLIIQVLNWRFPKRSGPEAGAGTSRYVVYGRPEPPTIHATSGVPTLQQLVEGMDLSPKAMGIAELLHEGGLSQFNHYINNRDGVIEDARRNMAELSDSLSQSEISIAEEIGLALARVSGSVERQSAKERSRSLALDGRNYAQYKCKEHDAQLRITRDLEKGVPRTDYTSVKARIAEGSATLSSIVSELPIQWQAIRTLNDRIARPPEPIRKPRKREFLHVMFLTSDQGVLEDKKAERDGNWIVSHKHDMLVPYQEPTRVLEFRHSNRRPLPVGEMVVIDQDPGPEWETELWRQGGFLDRAFLRARAGTSPEQLRRSYQLRQVRILVWGVIGALILANVVAWATRVL